MLLNCDTNLLANKRLFVQDNYIETVFNVIVDNASNLDMMEFMVFRNNTFINIPLAFVAAPFILLI